MCFKKKFSTLCILALGIILGASVSSCSTPYAGNAGGDSGSEGDSDAICSSSAPCSKGFVCSNGRCVGCTDDSSCATGQACIAGVCKNKAALGEACGTSTDCLDATMECASAPRSVCVKKVGESCGVDKDCLTSCVSSKCVEQTPSSGLTCSADTECPTNQVCSPASDPKLKGQKVCLKKDGQSCVAGTECLSDTCNGQCQPCVAGKTCTINNGGCSITKSYCSKGRTMCDGPSVALPDFLSCTDPNNALVDTCFGGKCKMKHFKKELKSGWSNYMLESNLWTDTKAHSSALANVPIYAELTIGAGVNISSADSFRPAMKLSGLPNGSIVKLVNNGQIWGGGGNGGQGGGVEESDYVCQKATDGNAGGHAIYTEHKLIVENLFGDIRGGGGGGGGGGGLFQWTDCWGHNTVQGHGGGGGGGAGAKPGHGGRGVDTPSNYFGVSKPGADGSEVAGGDGGEPYESYYEVGIFCNIFAKGGVGGNGGNWGTAGQDGDYSHDTGSSGARGATDTPRGKGGAGGYAVFRANGAALVWLDPTGREVTGNGTVMGSTEIPPP